MNNKPSQSKEERAMAIDETTNHKTLRRQVDFGDMLIRFKESHDNMHSPTGEEYNALPQEIKDLYPTYISYKNYIDGQNVITRGAMVSQINTSKAQYIAITGGNSGHKTIFDTEADELIADIGA